MALSQAEGQKVKLRTEAGFTVPLSITLGLSFPKASPLDKMVSKGG